MGISLANAGGLVGSNIFLVEEEPRYWTGYGVSLALVTIAIASTFVLRFTYKRINAKRDAMTEEEIRAKYTEQELLDLGDGTYSLSGFSCIALTHVRYRITHVSIYIVDRLT